MEINKSDNLIIIQLSSIFLLANSTAAGVNCGVGIIKQIKSERKHTHT
jgi:hypothetical protein